MLDIKTIQDLYAAREVVLTAHFMSKIRIRKIKLADVRHIITTGEIIEQYEDDYPHPSALITGRTEQSVSLHVVTGIGNGKLWLITAYYPTLDRWQDDFKTRKAGT